MHETIIASDHCRFFCFFPLSHAIWESSNGQFSIDGDAEINFDIVDNKHGYHQGLFTSPDAKKNTKAQINDDSRIKVVMDWHNSLPSGSFISAQAAPTFRTDNTYNVDEVYLKFGSKAQELWYFQLGRYEAMNLFPMGKDVVAFYAAGSDGMGQSVYYYMAKEARGRGNKAGQARLVGEYGNWTAELSSIYGNTAEIVTSGNIYLNDTVNEVTANNNSFMLRPAIQYKTTDNVFSFSFGGEYESNKDDFVTMKAPTTSGVTQPEQLNLSHRYGLAATATYQYADHLVWNTSAAMQDSKYLWKAYTFNTNIVYCNNFGLGVSYAENKFKQEDKIKAKSYIVYAAYTIPILDFDNAEVSFALSYSDTKNGYGYKGWDEQTTAFRTRFNYYF